MPVEMNEDGTVNIIPPWSLAELLEAMDYEFTQGENGVITIQSSTPKAKPFAMGICSECEEYVSPTFGIFEGDACPLCKKPFRVLLEE